MNDTDYRGRLGGPRLESQLCDAKPLYTEAEAQVEANRCLFCHDAPCITACPTAIDIPKFIKQIASDNLRGSARTILSANMLGLSCARVCPVEELCAGDCVYNDLNHKPIEIGRLQRYAVEHALGRERAGGRKLFTAKPPVGKKVALIGAGPASLACAAHLALAGATPVIFERDDLPGGLNTTGVAPYKFKTEDALDEVQWLLSHGVDLRCGVAVGQDVSFASLQAEYDAVFIGVGLGRDRLLGFEGEGVWGATALIRAVKNDPEFRLPAGTRTAIVIGGGNTAIDIARELAMLGVPEVRMVYRRSQAEMSGYRHEMEAARLYGVQLIAELRPAGAVSEGGRVRGARFHHAESGDEAVLPCDLLVLAIGQDKWADSFDDALALHANGTVKIDPQTRETSIEGVYAGGDCVNGGKEVVNAAADGREAAFAMLSGWGLQP